MRPDVRDKRVWDEVLTDEEKEHIRPLLNSVHHIFTVNLLMKVFRKSL